MKSIPTIYTCANDFTIFGCPLKEREKKIQLASFKTLANSKDFWRTDQNFCSDFPSLSFG
jgi:hypothetical protein